MDEFSQRAFQMRHRDSAIDAQTLDLKEHRVVGWIRRVATKYSAGRDHSHRRTATLHRMNLHGRGLRTEGKSFNCVEGVLRIAGRMTFRNIKRVEVIKVSFDLSIIFNRVTQRDENVFDPLAH